MKIALIGAELEENLGLRYITSSLEKENHTVRIVPFNDFYDLENVVQEVLNFSPEIAGLSMVFTSRGKEFCLLADKLRDSGYKGHIIAGGPFAALNANQLLKDFSSFDSIGMGEGESILCKLANNLDELSAVAGITFRRSDGSIKQNPGFTNPEDLDTLPFPVRSKFHDYFGLPIASIITSRGCWRYCAFCSIHAWYKQSGKIPFRTRSIENIVAEMKQLYHEYGVRIFNFQDDNFYLPDSKLALSRFQQLNTALKREGIDKIAIAVKARPDSITEESTALLKEMGLFRVFLGVENASENGLKNLNRKCKIEHIINALSILNKYDIHVAYNLLLFEPHTKMEDLQINLRFLENQINNPQNFCRAEVHAGTLLEKSLSKDGKLLGDYFSPDYRLNDQRCDIFHQIANYAFHDRNFNNSGLHYFNMQVDFYYHLLQRFYPDVLNQTIRSRVRNFIRKTNLDTFQMLSEIYDFVENVDLTQNELIQNFTLEMRNEVDAGGRELRVMGETLIDDLDSSFRNRNERKQWMPKSEYTIEKISLEDILNLRSTPIPYDEFKTMMGQNR